MYMLRSESLSGNDVTGDFDMIMEHEFSPNRGCCSFRPGGFHCWERMRGGGGRGSDEGWAVSAWKKMREWSELVAGPRWKTFIRRFGRNRVPAAAGHGRFGYDPHSYARNFDDGQSDEDVGFRPDFSSRYAVIPSSAKSSMDLGRDGPSFT
ncbi:hypothetical protein V2J09_008270 [Rumex salicifolius]